MGKLIVIEGLDGSGKATQTKQLVQWLNEQGYKAMQVSFPDYESNSSALIKMYLGGEFGTKPEDVNAYAASAFFAVDRFASYKAKWKQAYDAGYIIVADRYTTSNGVHQCSKLPQELWQPFMKWLYDFEYHKMGIPKPDCVIYLDMNLQVSQKLLSKRYAGDEAKKDIHEKDMQYLNRSRMAAQYCTNQGGWAKVSCDDGQNPLPIQEITQQIVNLVSEIL